MSLTPIPYEEHPRGSHQHGKKSFRPRMKAKIATRDQSLTKQICLKLVDFINRSSSYTIEQIDELIMGLQRLVLGLQRRKKEILNSHQEKNRENGKKRKRHGWFLFRREEA